MSFFDPHPLVVVTRFGPITAHGVAFALGGLIAAAVFAFLLQRAKVLRAPEAVERAFLIFAVGLFVARFGFLVTYPGEWQSFGQLFAIWDGGLVSFWGMAGGGVVALLLANRLKPAQRAEWWRAVVVACLAGWAVGRWGNYYMAESVGVQSSFWHLTYSLIPIQLFESVLCLVLAVVLSNKRIKASTAVWLGIVGYFAGRFIIDTWRDEALWAGLHVSQWVSLLVLICTGILYVRTRRAARPHS